MKNIELTDELNALLEKTFECSNDDTIIGNLKVFIRAVEADIGIRLTPKEKKTLLSSYFEQYEKEMCVYGV
jgi:hypothetical protein